jgi:hypothetical protein
MPGLALPRNVAFEKCVHPRAERGKLDCKSSHFLQSTHDANSRQRFGKTISQPFFGAKDRPPNVMTNNVRLYLSTTYGLSTVACSSFVRQTLPRYSPDAPQLLPSNLPVEEKMGQNYLRQKTVLTIFFSLARATGPERGQEMAVNGHHGSPSLMNSARLAR